MGDETKKEIDKWEFEDVLKSFEIDIKLTKTIILFFIIASFFFIFYMKISISLVVPGVLFMWFLFYLMNEHLLSKSKNIKQAYNIYSRAVLVELLLMTIIIHFLGGVEWIGGIFYILIVSLAIIALPKNKTRILIVAVAFFYLSLISLEFFEIIPHQTLFTRQAEINLYLDPKYVVITSITLIAFIFFSADMAGSYAEKLKEKRKELTEAQKIAMDAFEKTEEAKKVLEVRVAARTKELKFLTENLENQVRERTEDLEKKVKELEKINKLMIGRELKMVELKKELKKIKKKN